jgi:hypothetical protein
MLMATAGKMNNLVSAIKSKQFIEAELGTQKKTFCCSSTSSMNLKSC